MIILKVILLYLMAGFSVFLLGYAAGRRVGRKEGFIEGKVVIPVELKQKLMENGKCPFYHQDCLFLKPCLEVEQRRVM